MRTVLDVLLVAADEVGYQEKRNRLGRYVNRQKYSLELPGFAWSNGQPWCATFICWVFWQAGLYGLLRTPSASCDHLAAGFKAHGRWGTEPRPGAVVFYGTPNDLTHVGIVESATSSYIDTIEGNTNDEGGREGHEVARRRRYRSSAWIVGYGYPEYPKAAPPIKTPHLDKAEADLIAASKAKRPTLAASAVTEALRAVRRARRLTKNRRAA